MMTSCSRHRLLMLSSSRIGPSNGSCGKYLSSKAAASIATITASTTSESSYQQQQKIMETDVLIVGGGVIGCSMADLLTRRLPQLSVTLIEAGKGPPPPAAVVSPTNQHSTAPPHPRSYALSPTSLSILDITKENQRIGYYDSMQVWEESQPASLLFTKQDLPEGTETLGAVVEDGVLVNHLWPKVSQACTVHTESVVESLSLPRPNDPTPATVTVKTSSGNDDPFRIQARLVVGADGGNSQVREMAGISTDKLDYHQSALTFTVQTATPMNGRAYQRFLSTGPLALLPTFSKSHAIIVWSTTPQQVKEWKDNPHLVQYMNDLLQKGPDRLEPLLSSQDWNVPFLSGISLGINKLVELAQYGPALRAQQQQDEQEAGSSFRAPPRIVQVVSPQQFTFPLAKRRVSAYTAPRLALIGDAAHTVHPMAGYGLNLGLQDVTDLMRVLEKAVASGMDLATFLDDYRKSRSLQVQATVEGIHALHHVFHGQDRLGKHIKSLGMNMIQNVGPVRRMLVQAATQGVTAFPPNPSSLI